MCCIMVTGLTGCQSETGNEFDVNRKLDMITQRTSMTSSNPFDYVEANRETYDELLSHPKETFEFAVKDLIDTHADSGLKSYIEALLCSEINQNFDYDFDSAPDFLEHYIAYLKGSDSGEQSDYDRYAIALLE